MPSRQSRNSRKRKGDKRNQRGCGTVVNAYFGLPQEICKRLENRVKKTGKTRSHIVREALDSYALKVNKEPLSTHQANEKHPIIGLRTYPLTIRQDQDAWLRTMAEKTGKKLSHIGREAVEWYFNEK
jgi:predicted DNA-binding protein